MRYEMPTRKLSPLDTRVFCQHAPFARLYTTEKGYNLGTSSACASLPANCNKYLAPGLARYRNHTVANCVRWGSSQLLADVFAVGIAIEPSHAKDLSWYTSTKIRIVQQFKG